MTSESADVDSDGCVVLVTGGGSGLAITRPGRTLSTAHTHVVISHETTPGAAFREITPVVRVRDLARS